jgi:transmembrane sensor
LRLADGTRIDLNSGSRLTVRYSAGQRRVVMDQAEAAFDVARDARRPFVIQVGDGEVRVLGTAFDIRHYASDTQVSVSRGIVQFSTPTSVVKLAQGMAATHPAGGPTEVGRRDPKAALAWREGRLVYLDEPLSRVVDDLNRQFPRPIRLADEQTSRLRFTGVLVLGTQEDTLQRLTALLLLRSRTVGQAIVLSSRGP